MLSRFLRLCHARDRSNVRVKFIRQTLAQQRYRLTAPRLNHGRWTTARDLSDSTIQRLSHKLERTQEALHRGRRVSLILVRHEADICTVCTLLLHVLQLRCVGYGAVVRAVVLEAREFRDLQSRC